jgi:hypothetical protein
MRISIAAILAIVFLGSASADEGLTEEELVAPLVMKQNCILATERFEGDDSLCAEFDTSLRMVEKRWVRKPANASK